MRHHFLCFLFLATTGLAQQAADERAIYRAPPGLTELYEDEVSLPMERHSGRPLISAEINGHGPYQFILDTGSSLSAILDVKVLEEVGIELGEEVAVPGMPGRAAVLDSLLFDGVEMSDVHAVASDVARFFGGTSAAPHGILGVGLFADCLLTFDFPQQRFVIREGELPDTGAHVIEYENRGTVGFAVDVAGVPVVVHMDTGSPGTLTLPNSYEGQVPLTGEPKDAGNVRTPMGGASVRAATLDGTLRFAGHEFANLDVRFADLPQMVRHNVGNLGSGLLKQLAITFDQKNGRLRFESAVNNKGE